ncbi:diguanylate cyclase (GGDEF)-like protein [Methylopila capsulata]|uniref:Diguanylate cyclase (GGDEF)-like protein n=1 Tax=Methylopila capsulata TaxID=61654 RepID=A0ABS2T4U1_9HYPH|nr:sensor domain-containing diguanylate cyclase [Methylopila capsulata]MBM7851214.1 diguanylate cyclase (GGDEF)-like protein [Methylopila capsulata]
MTAERRTPACGTEGAHALGRSCEDLRLAALARYDVMDTPGEEAFDRIVRLTQKVFRTSMVTISLIDGHRQWFKARHGVGPQETARGPALCSSTIEQGSPLIVTDARRDPRFAQNPFVTGEPHIRFYAGAPLVTPDGQMLGTLCVMDQAQRAFTDDEREILVDLARIVIDELELRLLADADALTGALSRRAFRAEAQKAIDQAAHAERPLSLIVIDLDHFKRVNDTYGHDRGDAALIGSVLACAAQFAGRERIGRLGGEEFAVLLPDVGTDRALSVAERIREAIRGETYAFREGTFRVTASLGVTSAPADGACDIDMLLRSADMALYQAKAAGRNRCVVAASPIGRGAGLRRVLKRGSLVLGAGRESVPCTVRAVSAGRVRLDVLGAAELPTRFDLVMDGEDPAPCRVVTRSERGLEAAFE